MQTTQMQEQPRLLILMQEMITIRVLTTARTLVLQSIINNVAVTGAPFTYRFAQTPATVSVTGWD
jgi:hypothetical protein